MGRDKGRLGVTIDALPIGRREAHRGRRQPDLRHATFSERCRRRRSTTVQDGLTRHGPTDRDGNGAYVWRPISIGCGTDGPAHPRRAGAPTNPQRRWARRRDLPLVPGSNGRNDQKQRRGPPCPAMMSPHAPTHAVLDNLSTPSPGAQPRLTRQLLCTVARRRSSRRRSPRQQRAHRIRPVHSQRNGRRQPASYHTRSPLPLRAALSPGNHPSDLTQPPESLDRSERPSARRPHRPSAHHLPRAVRCIPVARGAPTHRTTNPHLDELGCAVSLGRPSEQVIAIPDMARQANPATTDSFIRPNENEDATAAY
jgi:hypothetical protein